MMGSTAACSGYASAIEDRCRTDKGSQGTELFCVHLFLWCICRTSGASSVVNVDISRKSLDRGRENYELNRLDCAEGEFVRADALTYMKLGLKKGNRFGCVILDPPSFARHGGKIFSVKKDFAVLIDTAMKILEPGGVLLAATNFSGLPHQALEEMVVAGGRERVKSIKQLGQDTDFRGSGRMPESYLAALLVTTR